MGDVSVLVVDADGTVVTKPILAPKLQSLEELVGNSLMIYEGSDNPESLGGGGRM